MVNHRKIQKMIEQEKIRLKQITDEKLVIDRQRLVEEFINFKNTVTLLLSEEMCNELQIIFDSVVIENPKSIYSKFYAFIPIDTRRKLELTSSDNQFWWLGVVAFHHDKFSHNEVKDASEGYWYASTELKERLLTKYEELTHLEKL